MGQPFFPRIQVFHEYLEQAMAALANENTVVAAALHNGGMACQRTDEFSQQLHHSASYQFLQLTPQIDGRRPQCGLPCIFGCLP
jgi:hypothetical protein